MPVHRSDENTKSAWWKQRSTMISAAVHGTLLAAIIGGFQWGPKVAPYRFPGTSKGVRTLTYFSAGRIEASLADAPAVKAVLKKPVVKAAAKLTTTAPAEAAAPQADLGTGASAKSGAGEGNVNIAQPRVFPYPNADVSSMARGAAGDVILNAVIDETGKVAELTLVQGLSSQINQTVLATVQGWSYAPATKDGVPVRSEQELRFHYERRG